MLKTLSLKAVYRSDEDNILQDFYLPALESAISYDRAVGYFSASMLSYASQGLTAFIKHDGKMRLVIGAELSEDESNAIKRGYDLRYLNDKFAEYFSSSIEEINDALFYRRLEALSWLVANGRLDIKVAFKKRGMYHEKIGIFGDEVGDKVVFQGSANESTRALLPDFNFESINVFPCWRKELSDHFQPYLDGFERLWDNKTKRTIVLDFPAAAKEKLIHIAKKAVIPQPQIEITLCERLTPYYHSEEINKGLLPSVPEILGDSTFELMDHQKEALNAWKANDFQGIMALATGAGKTITAIYGAVKIFEVSKKFFLVIAVPYQNLADQWVEVLRIFNIFPIQCYGSSNNWVDNLSKAITFFQTGAKDFVSIVVVNRTLFSHNFQNFLKQIPGNNLLFVGDECHYHSAEGLAKSLPGQARMRLGLSATPVHYVNHEATKRLISYYGNVLAKKYDLADALRDGVLTPYTYHVILVDLTPEETERYYDLSIQISQLAAQQGNKDLDPEPNGRLDRLLFERSRLLGSAQNKLVALRNLLSSIEKTKLSIFYCGDGSVEDEDTTEPMRQVNAVSLILQENGWTNAHFTSRESRKERQSILTHFRLGQIDSLVAIRCLDEGIDIPACRKAFILASSRNPKQFIQRRGRILRKAPGKEYAEIYDFVVKMPYVQGEGSVYERCLIKRELERVAEFVRLSKNKSESINILMPILEQYRLEHCII